MPTVDPTQSQASVFDDADTTFENIKDLIESPHWQSMDHDEVEESLDTQGRELLRQLYQAFITLSGIEQVDEEPVVGCDDVERTHRRRRTTTIASIFGNVRHQRTGYSARGADSLFPADARLNLPQHSHSLALRRRAADLATHVSFDQATRLLGETTGTEAGKRQVEQMTACAGVDFDAFYRQRQPSANPEDTADILVLSIDKKGIVVREQDLKEKTRIAARTKKPKLDKRRSGGERRNRKRMAVAAAVYTIEPFTRSAPQVVQGLRGTSNTTGCPRPSPEHKRVWANIVDDSEQVVEQAFQEALSRDPNRTKRWVVLVDADQHQLCWIRRAAKRHGVEVSIVLDIIHVIEYLWMAARAFCGRYTKQAEQYVAERLLKVLEGKAGWVAGGMRRSAKHRQLPKSKKKRVEKCANYLKNHSEYLRYDEALAGGLPISTGVIEGACRHLIGDRLEITGARWSLQGAEAVLRLRALQASNDFDAYWEYHRKQEYQRNHAAHYAGGEPPGLRAPTHPELRLIK